MTTTTTTTIAKVSGHVTCDLALLVGRILLSAMHLVGGYHRFVGLAADTAWYASMGVPLPQYAAPLAGAVMLLSGLLLLVGWQTRFAAFLFGAFILLDAIVVAGALKTAADQYRFLTDMAIVGGCLAFYAAGPGRFSIDGRRH